MKLSNTLKQSFALQNRAVGDGIIQVTVHVVHIGWDKYNNLGILVSGYRVPRIIHTPAHLLRGQRRFGYFFFLILTQISRKKSHILRKFTLQTSTIRTQIFCFVKCKFCFFFFFFLHCKFDIFFHFLIFPRNLIFFILQWPINMIKHALQVNIIIHGCRKSMVCFVLLGIFFARLSI